MKEISDLHRLIGRDDALRRQEIKDFLRTGTRPRSRASYSTVAPLSAAGAGSRSAQAEDDRRSTLGLLGPAATSFNAPTPAPLTTAPPATASTKSPATADAAATTTRTMAASSSTAAAAAAAASSESEKGLDVHSVHLHVLHGSPTMAGQTSTPPWSARQLLQQRQAVAAQQRRLSQQHKLDGQKAVLGGGGDDDAARTGEQGFNLFFYMDEDE